MRKPTLLLLALTVLFCWANFVLLRDLIETKQFKMPSEVYDLRAPASYAVRHECLITGYDPEKGKKMSQYGRSLTSFREKQLLQAVYNKQLSATDKIRLFLGFDVELSKLKLTNIGIEYRSILSASGIREFNVLWQSCKFK